MSAIRKPAVAGQFYAADAAVLVQDVARLLDALNLPDIRVQDAAHTFEHSLEVHLPFLQTLLAGFTLVPVVVGDTGPERVARTLDALWNGPETLIVISSDLSHYRAYADAQAMDAVTRAAIEHLDAARLDHEMACGATPVAGLLLAARRHGLSVRTLDVRNSGDTSGDRSSVVGYGSWILY